MKQFLNDFIADLRQVFEDQKGEIDDKRIAGLALVASGVVYIWTRHVPLQPLDYGQIVLGLASLGVSIMSDKLGISMPVQTGGSQ